MATPSEQLEAMRRLGENWDGYGAAAPQLKIIDLAQEFVSLIGAMLRKSSTGQAILHVSPTRVGGVLIEWEDAAMDHEVELNDEGSISFLHHDKGTGKVEFVRRGPTHTYWNIAPDSV